MSIRQCRTQIARLQLPVLRVAMQDMSFFNSRKHPVRRFVNRIATLSAAFDDSLEGMGPACLARVKSLIDDVVDGEFDRMDLYEAKLAELEARLDPRRFVRIHRATLVNTAFVQELDAWVDGGQLVRLRDEAKSELSVARDRVRDLKTALGI